MNEIDPRDYLRTYSAYTINYVAYPTLLPRRYGRLLNIFARVALALLCFAAGAGVTWWYVWELSR